MDDRVLEYKSMPKPAKQYFPFRNHYNVGLLLFGRGRGETDWSLRDIRRQRDLTNERCDLARRIATIVHQHEALRGVTTFYAPRLDFSGRIAKLPEFTHRIELAMPPDRITMLRDDGSDGTEIPPGTAVLLNGADCPSVFFFLPQEERVARLLATHCARWSLLNQCRVLGKHPQRTYEGVVENAIETLGKENVREIQVHIACSISGKHFRHSVDDPRYGEQNKNLVQYVVQKWGAECFVGNLHDGRLHLPALVRAQCRELGILDEHITRDDEDTFSATEPCSEEPKWWSYVRATTRPKERQNAYKRNLAIMVHRQ
jgi:hypothetical protein